MPTYPRIPYGWADFEAIRLERRLYVDKTRFLHELEEERFAFLIRPRRFGKSCWVSLLEHYYDRNRAGRFETLFGGTDIGRNPTPNRSRYVILRFDFSAVNDALETLEREFEIYCTMELTDTLERNPDLFPPTELEHIMSPSGVNGRLNALFLHAARHGIPSPAEFVRTAAMTMAKDESLITGRPLSPGLAQLIEHTFRGVLFLSTLKRDELIREGREDEVESLVQAGREAESKLLSVD